MTEAELQKEVIAFAIHLGLIAGKVNMEGRRGFPDVLVIYPDWHHLYIELKTPTGRLRPEQKRTHRKMERFNGDVIVCRTAEDTKQAITERYECHAGGDGRGAV